VSLVTAGRGEVRLRVRVQPRSSHERVAGAHGDRLRLQVNAPPVGGAANEAVVALLADWLAVPKRAVAIVLGASSRDKTVSIVAADPEHLASEIERRIAAVPGK
jgi:hypothetical protein